MEEEKRKRIEEKLRQLFLDENQAREDARPAGRRRSSGVRVIRRRKGAPDMHIA